MNTMTKQTSPASVKQLSNLGDLLESNKPGSALKATAITHASVTEVDHLVLNPADALSTNIFRIMSNYAGWTIPEIAKRLESIEPDAGIVKTTMTWLNNAGWFTFSKPTAHQDVVYTLKRGLKHAQVEKGTTMSLKANKTFSLPQVAEHDPAGVIKTGEPLELSIWKIMADRKQRTVGEAGELLATFGINREKAKDEFIKLAHRGWFIRRTRHKTTYYTLRKDVRMPGSNAEKELVDSFKPEAKASNVVPNQVKTVPIPQRNTTAPTTVAVNGPKVKAPKMAIFPYDTKPVKVWKVMSDYSVYTVAQVGELLAPYGLLPRAVAALISDLKIIHDWFTVSYTGRCATYQLKPGIEMPGKNFLRKSKARPSVTAEVKELKLHDTSIVLTGDTLPIKIWKVMSDYRPYTACEVGLLLSEYGVNEGTASSTVSILNREHNWFDVDRSKRAFAFILKRDIPMPGADFVVSKGAKAGVTAAATPEAAPKADAVAVKPTVLAAEAPLVEIIVRLKGVDLTFSEAHEVTKALVSQGYGAGKSVVVNNSLINTSVAIKGKFFSAEELEEVAKQLLGNNFGK